MFNFLNHETLFYEICTNYFKRLFSHAIDNLWLK